MNLKDGSVFYAQGQSEQNRFIKVFLQKKTNNKISVITSEYAEIQSLDNDANRLVFFNGQRYEGELSFISLPIEEYKAVCIIIQ